MIHVAFPLHDSKGNYSKFVGTAICSVLENTKQKLVIHLLHDGTLTNENKIRFELLCKTYDSTIVFHLLDPDLFEQIECIRCFTVGTVLRLYLADILLVDKIIYLDADVIVNLDIKELWDFDLQGKACAARQYGMPEYWLSQTGMVNFDKYFNSGVMIFNLAIIRKKYNLLQQAIDFFNEYPACQFADNDALNYIFQEDVIFFEEKYNCFTKLRRRSQTNQILNERAIFHFAGDYPREAGTYIFDKLFWYSLQKTPWWNSKTVCDYYMDYIGKKQNEIVVLKNLLQRNLQAKKIVFYGAKSESWRDLADTFKLNERNGYYVDNNADLWQTKIKQNKIYSPQILQSENIKDLLIIVASFKYYDDIKISLENMGFRENRDFFDGRIVLDILSEIR